MSHPPLGLIAGNLNLPLVVAQKIRDQGSPLVVVGLKGETDPKVATLADAYLELPLGQLQPLADFFLQNGTQKICLIGGVSRDNVISAYQPDAVALELMAALDNFHTDAILRAVGGWLEAQGLSLVATTDLVPDLAIKPGQLSKTRPSPSLLADLRLAYQVAKELGRLDVGQTVVVSDKIVVALEGADGTDETIRRGASLCRKPVAVAKVVKPTQDLRLDPPVVGPATFEALIAAEAGALALDARGLIFLERDLCLARADDHNLAVVAWLNAPPA